jgi:hypothetical protein
VRKMNIMVQAAECMRTLGESRLNFGSRAFANDVKGGRSLRLRGICSIPTRRFDRFCLPMQ